LATAAFAAPAAVSLAAASASLHVWSLLSAALTAASAAASRDRAA